MGVMLRNDDDGVTGGVTGGVRLPLLWRCGVEILPRPIVLDNDKDSFG